MVLKSSKEQSCRSVYFMVMKALDGEYLTLLADNRHKTNKERSPVPGMYSTILDSIEIGNCFLLLVLKDCSFISCRLFNAINQCKLSYTSGVSQLSGEKYPVPDYSLINHVQPSSSSTKSEANPSEQDDLHRNMVWYTVNTLGLGNPHQIKGFD